MITNICWVPKGAAKSVPDVADPPTREELEEVVKNSTLEDVEEIVKGGAFDGMEGSESEDDDTDMDVDATKQSDKAAQALAVAAALGKNSENAESATHSQDIDDAMKELNMDDYDKEDNGIVICNSDTYYPSNDMDPYLIDKNGIDSEEEEDITIKPADAVVICTRSEEFLSLLEACIFLVNIIEDTKDGTLNLYNHHDIVLSAFPLCTAWLDCPLKDGEKGNFIAVGSMEPAIEIWDLDIIDEVEPCLVLGGVAEKKKKGKKKSIKFKKDSHRDSVLNLAWNKQFRNLLASASADKSVKIWDLSTGKCNDTMEHHTDKVQAVAWNDFAPQILISGSFDHSIVMKDARIPLHDGFKWSVAADVESLAWDPHTEHSFVVSLENGTVQGFDIRAAMPDSGSSSKPSFTLHAHDKAVTSVSYNHKAPNVKLWDLSNNHPSCVATKELRAGAVFSVSFSEDKPFLLAVGGSKGKLRIWDTFSEDAVSRRYGKNL
ncbi:WD40 repeat [Dillenia turbinata]|uniref:WD40 repeat n=1 Tax=Dillenia turbinata TaxID=194707 RepID=A0AAN8Z2X0_9MAGN